MLKSLMGVVVVVVEEATVIEGMVVVEVVMLVVTFVDVVNGYPVGLSRQI